MSNPAARWRVTEAPTKAPGNCFTCKGVRNKPFIDTGLRIDYYREKPNAERDGNVYICSACVKDMYHTLISGDPEVTRRIEEARRAGVTEVLDKVAEALDVGFVAIGASLSSISVDSPPSDPPVLSQDDGADAVGAQEDAGAEPETSEQDSGTASGEGSDGVSDDRVDGRKLSALLDF